MRVLALVLAALVALPFAHALPGPVGSPPAAHVQVDATAYRAQVDAAVQYALGFQKPDGGIYVYSFLLKDTDNALALKLLARAQNVDVRGPNLSALIRYFEQHQNVDGSFGQSSVTPTITSDAILGLLDAGYDVNSPMLQRALTYTRLSQSVTGAWSDGSSPASHQTAWNVEILLRAGASRGEARLQQAIGFILSCQDAATGGFAPTTGWFTTPAATAAALEGLDAYLRAPSTGSEAYAQAQVQAAVDAALAYLAAQIDPATGKWQASIGANAQIVGPAARYHAERGLAFPAWLQKGIDTVLAYQAPNGGLYNDPKATVIFEWTLEAFAGLLEAPRALGSSGSLAVQSTVNAQGAYGNATTTVSLVSASGATLGSVTGPAGLATLSWTGASPGRHVVRVTSPGATSFETGVWIS